MSEWNLILETPRWAFPLLEPARYKGASGGRSGGKSHLFAELIVELMVRERNTRIVCIREIQKSLKFSAKQLIEDKIRKLGVGHLFDINQIEIRPLKGQGVIIFQGMQDHTAESIKSLEGFDVAWVEEAQSISARSMELLLPTIRKPHSEIWFTWNPQNHDDPVELLKNDMVHVTVNYTENPFCPVEVKQEADRHKKANPKTFPHVWLGDYYNYVDNSIVLPEWFEAAIDSHIKLNFKVTGIKSMIYDPADQGPDSKGYHIRHGVYIYDYGEIEATDGNTATDQILDLAIQHDVNRFIWDCDGMGALLRRDIELGLKHKEVELIEYKGSHAPDIGRATTDHLIAGDYKCEDIYKNKRAQRFTEVSRRFYNTYRAVEYNEYIHPDKLISINGKLPLLNKFRSEMCRIPRVENGAGKIQIMNKKDLKKIIKLDSPAMADCAAMGEEPVHLKVKHNTLRFETISR